MDDIADCQHNLESFGWCMYIGGRNVSHAEPVQLFECLNRRLMPKSWILLKKKPALDRYCQGVSGFETSVQFSGTTMKLFRDGHASKI